MKPVKRRGNRRYYQRQDVLVIRQIRSLLYEQGFTISGARNRLADPAQVRGGNRPVASSSPGWNADAVRPRDVDPDALTRARAELIEALRLLAT